MEELATEGKAGTKGNSRETKTPIEFDRMPSPIGLPINKDIIYDSAFNSSSDATDDHSTEPKAEFSYDN